MTIPPLPVFGSPVVRRLTARWLGPLPSAGAFVRSGRARYAYRILEVLAPRSTGSEVFAGAVVEAWRMVLRCERIPVGDVPAGAVVYAWRWDSRGRRR